MLHPKKRQRYIRSKRCGYKPAQGVSLKDFNLKLSKSNKLFRNYWWQRQKGLCYYCRTYIAIEDATLEHVVPLSNGGKHVISNCRMACEECNNERS